MTGETEEDGRSGVERWLGSPLRRIALALACVVVLAVLTAGMWADEALAFGGKIDWTYAAARRAVRWAPWALLFEPLFWSIGAVSRKGRGVLALVLLHLPVSFGVAVGVAILDPILADRLLGPAPWAEASKKSWRKGESTTSAGATSSRADSDDHETCMHIPTWSRFRAEGGLATYWILLGLGWGVSTFLQNREQERRTRTLDLRAARLERDLMEAQLSNLRSQLHPHFLFNALHSLGALIRERREPVALSTLSSLSSLLRTMIDRGTRTEVSLNEELELVDRYLEIERLRLGKRLVDTTRVEPGVGGARVPALCMLPIVENAIKYGIAPRAKGGCLEIDVRRDGERVRIEVSDDGPGFPPEVLRGEGESVGLSNTKARLEALYGDLADLRVDNGLAGGARVTLWVPDLAPGAAAGGGGASK